MPEDSRLVKAAEKTAREADRISAAFARQLSSVMRDAERRIRDWLLISEPPSRTVQVRASQALAVRQQVRTRLREAGYADLLDVATGAALDRMAERVLAGRRIAKVAANLAPEAQLTLEAMRTIHLQDLLEEGEVITRAITQAVTRGMLSRQAVTDILTEVAKMLDLSQARVGTLYDTAVSIYGRQVEALAAGNDPETKFLYAGPVDERTRDFCLEIVGQVFTRAEIDDMDNGQLSSVYLTGGGFSCRHHWIEISQFSELQELAGTDRRVPEVAEQVQDL